MDKKSQEFLEKLLKTPSPSGNEMEIQKVWIDYVNDFAHKIETDFSGNAVGILNPEKPFKVMLAGHCDEIGFMVTHIDDKGFVYVAKVGGISPKPALAMQVKILGKKGILKGVVAVKAEHQGGTKGELKIEDICIDCGASSKEEVLKFIDVGDYAIYDFDYEYLLNNRITARGLDNRTGAFIVAEVMKRLSEKNLNVGVYSVSTVNEETNMGGAYFAGAGIEPSMAIACDVTFATDYPGMDPKKDGEVYLGKGPVLSKGAQINFKINDIISNTAEDKGIDIQWEITPRTTGTDADKIRFSGKGVPVALLSLPLRYMHSPKEVVSIDDIENEIELLVKMIEGLTGNENLKPLE